MAIIRHGDFRRTGGQPHLPHIEQLALHAAILALTVTVVLVALVG